MGKPGPKASNIFQKLKLGNNSVKSMPKHDTSPVKFDKTDSEAAYGGGTVSYTHLTLPTTPYV